MMAVLVSSGSSGQALTSSFNAASTLYGYMTIRVKAISQSSLQTPQMAVEWTISSRGVHRAYSEKSCFESA